MEEHATCPTAAASLPLTPVGEEPPTPPALRRQSALRGEPAVPSSTATSAAPRRRAEELPTPPTLRRQSALWEEPAEPSWAATGTAPRSTRRGAADASHFATPVGAVGGAGGDLVGGD